MNARKKVCGVKYKRIKVTAIHITQIYDYLQTIRASYYINNFETNIIKIM